MPGSVWGMLTEVGSVSGYKGETRFLYRCKCEKEKVIIARSVRSGATRSCGCLQAAIAATQHRKHGHTVGSVSVEYNTWRQMIRRCHVATGKDYADYGGRGIFVCDEWRHDFSAFLAHIGVRPSRGHSIDRIDNERGYEPGNVRWATIGEQRRNSRRIRLITFNGKTQCLKDWATELGICCRTLSDRLKRWTLEQAMTTPAGVRKQP